MNPNGDEITYPLRYEFLVSNNEAKYEALLVSLLLTHELVARHL